MRRINFHQAIFWVIVLAVLNFLVRIPFFNLPLHHDELTYFDGIIRIQNNNLNPFVEFWGYKPPVFYEPLAYLFTFFGPSVVWGRLFTAFYSSLSLVFIFLLGRRLFNEKIALLATLLLFSFPLFAAQSFLGQPAVLITLLSLITLYAYFSEKKALYLLGASLLVLTHEPNIFLPLFLPLVNFLRKPKGKKKNLLGETVFLLLPLSVFIIWMTVNKIQFGWFLWPQHLSSLAGQSFFSPSKLSDILDFAFRENLGWLLFLTIIMASIFSWARKVKSSGEPRLVITFFLVLYLFYLVCFYKTIFLPRYLLFLYPLVFLAFVWSLEEIFFRRKLLAHVFIIGFFFFFIWINFYNLFFLERNTTWGGEKDLSFLRIILLQQKAAQYLNENYPDSPIVAPWPIYQAFRSPLYGYTQKTRNNLECVYKKEGTNNCFFNSNFNSRPIVFVYSSSYLDEWCMKQCLKPLKLWFIKKITLDYFPKDDYVSIWASQ